jgi:hypothetical protein
MKFNALRSARSRSAAFLAAALCAVLGATAPQAHADTIFKLSLGETGPDVSLAGGALNTTDDGIVGTPGNQNTAVDYTGFLSGFLPDITTSTASVSLNGLTTIGPAQQFGSIVLQNYTGGILNLHDSANNLLLSAVLTSSTLSGTVGAPATGAVFTSGIATPVAGSLLPFIAPNSLSLSMTLTNVNAGAGLSVVSNVLQPFTADASIDVAADPGAGIPEPATLSLALVGATALLVRRRSPRRS